MLESDIELFAAALSQVRVYVVNPLSDDMVEVVDYGEAVEKITPDSIKINGCYFMREQFKFRVDVKKDSTGKHELCGVLFFGDRCNKKSGKGILPAENIINVFSF